MEPTTRSAEGPTPRRGLLIDYGGVLTTPIAGAFGTIDERHGLEAGHALRLIAEHPQVRTAFVGLETGTLEIAEFERIYAQGLSEVCGREVEAAGLVTGIGGHMDLVPEMVELVSRVRAAGVPVALVSNSMGNGGYDALDLESVFDVVVLSGQVGMRKPSRSIYRLACARLGIPESECVLVDDLQQNLDGAARLDIAGVLHRTPTQTIEQVSDLLGLTGADDGRLVAAAEGE